MIVNVNQCASAFDETLHALKFSAIARKVFQIVLVLNVITEDCTLEYWFACFVEKKRKKASSKPTTY